MEEGRCLFPKEKGIKLFFPLGRRGAAFSPKEREKD
jgi:hypothetical protein